MVFVLISPISAISILPDIIGLIISDAAKPDTISLVYIKIADIGNHA